MIYLNLFKRSVLIIYRQSGVRKLILSRTLIAQFKNTNYPIQVQNLIQRDIAFGPKKYTIILKEIYH